MHLPVNIMDVKYIYIVLNLSFGDLRFFTYTCLDTGHVCFLYMCVCTFIDNQTKEMRVIYLNDI